MRSVVDTLEQAQEKQGEGNGLKTGFYDLDKLLRGMRPGQLIVLAGLTGRGKSALALNILERVAVDDGIPSGIFTLEMSNKELGLRLACGRARVPIEKVLSGATLSAKENASLTVQMAKISASTIRFRDQGGLSIYQLAAAARRMVQRHKIKFLVVDYLQLLQGQRKENRTVEVGEISRGLKALAKELQLPILALAQLSRESERGERKFGPLLSDLRESGSIEQDADIVLFVHPQNPNDESDRRPVKLMVKKNRGGRLGSLDLVFNAPITRFENAAHELASKA